MRGAPKRPPLEVIAAQKAVTEGAGVEEAAPVAPWLLVEMLVLDWSAAMSHQGWRSREEEEI